MFFLHRFVDLATRVHYCLTILSMISELSINLSKSTVQGIGRGLDFAIEIVNELHYRSGLFPMNYLGLPLGGRLVDCSR